MSGDLPSEPLTAVAVAPDDPQVLYVGADGFVFRSDDGGESWRPVLSFPRGVAIDDTELDAADVAGDAADTPFDDVPGLDFGSMPAGALDLEDDREDALEDDLEDAFESDLRRDSRGGAGRFEFGQFDAANDPMPEGDLLDQLTDVVALARAGAGVRRIAVSPGSGAVWVATPRGLYRSTNGGRAFDRIAIPGGVRESDVRDVVVDAARPRRLYVGTAAGLFVSPDGGATIEVAMGRVGRVPVTSVASERTPSGSHVVVGSERGLFRSVDGGDSFLDVLLRGLPPFPPVAAVAIAAADATLYAGTARGLYVGPRGASLLERRDGVSEALVQALSPDPFRPRALAMGTRARGIIFSSDHGLSVDLGAEQVPAGEVFAIARGIALDDVVVATERGVYRSQPGTGVAVTTSGLGKLQQRWMQEPPLDEVTRAAVAWNRLGNDVLGQMRERARTSGWLPGVLLRYVLVDGRTTRRDQFLLRASDDLPPGLDPNNDQTDLFGNIGAFVIQPALGVRHAGFIQLLWDLDRTVLSDGEVVALRRGPQWWAAERALVERVQSLWAARRRIMTEAELAGERTGMRGAVELIHRQLRVDELTAQLDGLTGGAFSRSLGADARDGAPAPAARRSRRARSPIALEDVQEE